MTLTSRASATSGHDTGRQGALRPSPSQHETSSPFGVESVPPPTPPHAYRTALGLTPARIVTLTVPGAVKRERC